MGFGDVGLCGISKYICERKQRYKIALKRMPSYQILLFGIAKDLLKYLPTKKFKAGLHETIAFFKEKYS